MTRNDAAGSGRTHGGRHASGARAIHIFVLFFFTVTAALAGSKPPLLIAYFVPSDRNPIPGYVDRLDRAITDVQTFYRKGMQAAGYGPMSFDIARDPAGKLEIHLVRGKDRMHAYGRDASEKVRTEVAASLEARGIDVNDRTLLIFEVLLEWREGRAVEVGPYVGGGNHLAGTAWVYDDALLDPRQLGSRAPGGYYGGPCSIGAFNSHYIGGVAHELGHALGLPHVAGASANPKHSLMGDGNHTYGEELRGEGPGSCLHPASAMLLAKCRPFAGNIEGAKRASTCEIKDCQVSFQNGQLVLNGHLEAEPPAFGLVAYNDLEAIPSDYDAKGSVSEVDGTGGFRLSMGDLCPGAYELRLQACHTNGTVTGFSFQYTVDSQGIPNLEPFSPAVFRLQRAAKAYARRDRELVKTLVAELRNLAPLAPEVVRQANHLLTLLQPAVLRPPTAIPPDQREANISELEFTTESVGWGRPLRDQVLVEAGSSCFLQVDGRFYEHGLFAHAPSRHVLDLQGKWRRFKSGYGLQDGHAGSVVFVLRGDGRELFRSRKIVDHRFHSAESDLAGVNQLEMLVEDATDGSNSDWAVWLTPMLER